MAEDDTVNEEEAEINTKRAAEPNDDLDHAACKIQAGFKGMQIRRKYEAVEVKISDDATPEKKISEDEATSRTEDTKSPAKEAAPLEDSPETLAAIKIQAGFEGYQTRRKLRATETRSDVDDAEMQKSVTKIQAGFRGYKVRKELSANTEVVEEHDPDLEKAAVLFQAGFRGFAARKQLRETSADESRIDTDEAAKQDAVIKIQAGFVGYKTRKNVSGSESETQEKPEDQSPDEVAAATKLQAGFRGYKVRKQMQLDLETESPDKPRDESADEVAGNKRKRTNVSIDKSMKQWLPRKFKRDSRDIRQENPRNQQQQKNVLMIKMWTET